MEPRTGNARINSSEVFFPPYPVGLTHAYGVFYASIFQSPD